MFRQPLRNAKQRLRLFLSECGRRARVLRDSLRRQPNRIDPSSRFVPGFRYGYWEREARGLELLKEWLSPEQFAQYDAKSYFEVTGCHSGKRYRISHGTSMNIHCLNDMDLQRRTADVIETRLAAITDTAANLKAQLCELNRLRDRIRKESTTMSPKNAAHRP